MHQQVHSRLDMERELRLGLNAWRYTLRYLPEVSLHTGEVEHVEALLRFQHPEFGLLDAGRFLEIAEQIGIMPELGRKALAQATQEIVALSDDAGVAGAPGLVVDLSARQLSDPDAVRHMLAILRDAGVAPERVTLECTESALSGNDGAVLTLCQLASEGFKFTLDDFGAGSCSFNLLSQLPMSSIKIDRTFVQQVAVSDSYRELVGALVAFSRHLGLRTVAEGVESMAQIEILRALGCDSAQGYYFGKPSSLSADFMRECRKVELLSASRAA